MKDKKNNIYKKKYVNMLNIISIKKYYYCYHKIVEKYILHFIIKRL